MCCGERGESCKGLDVCSGRLDDVPALVQERPDLALGLGDGLVIWEEVVAVVSAVKADTAPEKRLPRPAPGGTLTDCGLRSGASLRDLTPAWEGWLCLTGQRV